MPNYRPDPRRPSGGWDPFGRAPPDGWPWWRRLRWRPILLGLWLTLIAAGAFLRILVPEAWREPSARSSAPITPTPPVHFQSASEKPDPRTALPRPAKPITSPVNWVFPNDYPAAALRENIAGHVKSHFVVDIAGRATNCTVIQSSGSPILDATTCGLIEQHGHYWPARDRTGRAIPASETLTFRWVIPLN